MSELPLPIQIVMTALLVIGAAFALIGAWALVKLDNFLLRLHGPSKIGTVGVGCVLLASALHFVASGDPSVHELLIVVFIFLTAPISAHLLVKAALRLDPRLRPPAPPPPQ
jgi:multicomponent K+:H+ antiporter subunit G